MTSPSQVCPGRGAQSFPSWKCWPLESVTTLEPLRGFIGLLGFEWGDVDGQFGGYEEIVQQTDGVPTGTGELKALDRDALLPPVEGVANVQRVERHPLDDRLEVGSQHD